MKEEDMLIILAAVLAKEKSIDTKHLTTRQIEMTMQRLNMVIKITRTRTRTKDISSAEE